MSNPEAHTACWTADPALRGELYCWLAAAFYAPEADLVTPSFADCGRQLRTALLPVVPAEQVQRLLEANQREAGESERLVDLKREYARLFLGPPKALLRPYESCYFGRDQLMTEQSAAVRQFYAACGLTVDTAQYRETPDHISVELAFLAMLCDVECAEVAVADADRADVERQFLDQHLGRWGRWFAEAVQHHTSEPLYLAAAELLRALLQSHYQEGN